MWGALPQHAVCASPCQRPGIAARTSRCSIVLRCNMPRLVLIFREWRPNNHVRFSWTRAPALGQPWRQRGTTTEVRAGKHERLSSLANRKPAVAILAHFIWQVGAPNVPTTCKYACYSVSDQDHTSLCLPKMTERPTCPIAHEKSADGEPPTRVNERAGGVISSFLLLGGLPGCTSHLPARVAVVAHGAWAVLVGRVFKGNVSGHGGRVDRSDCCGRGSRGGNATHLGRAYMVRTLEMHMLKTLWVLLRHGTLLHRSRKKNGAFRTTPTSTVWPGWLVSGAMLRQAAHPAAPLARSV